MPIPDTVLSVAIGLAYLIAAALFILGLKRLSSPRTARSGNRMGATGMLIAVVVTLLHQEIVSFTWILVGVVTGGAIGVVLARRVRMTAMPQLVGLLNGFGGGASALVAIAEYVRIADGAAAADVAAAAAGIAAPVDVLASIMLSALIGGVTFSGSVIAFGKLQGLVSGRPIAFPFQRPLTAVLIAASLGAGAVLTAGAPDLELYGALALAALVIGVLLVLPIGGADMPVVVSLLNSLSGLAASMTGFVLRNNLLIIAGALVGASGLILTLIMCRAMNRSLPGVLFGAFGGSPDGGAGGGPGGARTVREVTPEDGAILLGYARSVIFVPGYGMAVAQAQHQVREVADMLEDRGVEVKFAIHPVAGRMPGHMNVLLAEANVGYDKLFEMERVNPAFGRTDVAVVIGANDVVNPAARDVPDSPIYGMPILNVDEAQTVVVMKRSLNPGYAGIDNELFYRENTRMLFGDAKDSLTALAQQLKVGV